MIEDRENITWQPISFLPQIAEMIDGMLGVIKQLGEILHRILSNARHHKTHNQYLDQRGI